MGSRILKYYLAFWVFGFLFFGGAGIPGNPGGQTLYAQEMAGRTGYEESARDSDGLSEAWLETLRERPEELKQMYTADAVRVFADGNTLQGDDQLAALWTDQDLEVDSLATIGLLEPHDDTYRYEVSELTLRDGRTFRMLVIWNLEWPGPRRELEMVEEVRPVKNFRDQLQARRAQWMNHCNAHEVEQLVRKLYTPDALYYNHRPMITGREALINTYQYMRNPRYKLSLEPLLVAPVNEKLIFEIGQCSGSYPGKYILVWNRDEEGKWWIMMDSNI
ncbi:hypothetical protein [Robiginitalea biformata]|uniref:hypothetical protein n=2 Tax=Robiginitalea biformata TaxID=252307 RepID=UPI003BAAFAE6